LTYCVCQWLTGSYRVGQSTAFSILNALISSSNLPDSILKSITTHSINAALESNFSQTRNSHRLLVSLQQRHPNIVEDVSRLSIDENEGQEESIGKLLLSLSVVGRIGFPLWRNSFIHLSAEDLTSASDPRDGHGGCINGREQ